MLIHSHSSLENHARFQTEMDKVYTRFQTKTAQKPYCSYHAMKVEMILAVE